jgi:hypothetical protein
MALTFPLVSNRGAEELAKLTHNRGEQQRLAASADLDVGYVGRLAKAERSPGLEARQKLQKHARIPMQWWDEPPTPEQIEERAEREAEDKASKAPSEPPPAPDVDEAPPDSGSLVKTSERAS